MITIIGGSGFIGSCLAKQLELSEQKFQIVDKSPSTSFPSHSIVADIRDTQQLSNAISGDTIIHLAAEHRDDVSPASLYYDVNVEGTKNICAIAEQKNIQRIVFTSTVAVYGFAPKGTDESGETNPFNDYGKSKLAAEKILTEWQQAAPTERSLTILRPTVVFGAGNRGNVYNLIRQIATGKFLMIGSGSNVKSLAYVENIAAFLAFSATSNAGVTIKNYVDKPDFSTAELVNKIYSELGRRPPKARLPYSVGFCIGKVFDGISKVTGKNFPISSIRVKKFCADTCFNSATQMPEEFSPPFNLSAALSDTISKDFLSDTTNTK